MLNSWVDHYTNRSFSSREFKTSSGQYFDIPISTRDDKDNQRKLLSLQKIKKKIKKNI